MAAWQIAILVLALPVFLWLSRPVEVRAARWIQILLSYPLLFAFTSEMRNSLSREGGGKIIACILALTFIWRGNVAFLIGGGLTRMIFGGAEHSQGTRPDFRFAYIQRREGEYEEAIKLVRRELTLDPHNFEGLMLLVTVYQEMKKPKEALTALEQILNSPTATVAQRADARAEQLKCRQLQKHLDAQKPG